MTLGERLKEARETAGLTQSQIARLFGISRNAVSLWESGENAPTGDKIGEIAKATGFNGEWLWSERGPKMGSVDIEREAVLVGYIGAGEKVYRTSEGSVLEGGIKPPSGYTRALAARVRGNSMKPLEPNWLVFYEAEHGPTVNPLDHLNKLCAVGLEDGSAYIKKLTRKGGQFILKSWNPDTADIVDAKVAWASPIIEIRPT